MAKAPTPPYKKAAGKKAPAKKKASEWKADFGDGAKPGSMMTIVATGQEKITEGNKVTYKITGAKLIDTAKEVGKKHGLDGEKSQKVVTAMLRAACGEGCNSAEDICPADKFNVAIADINELGENNKICRDAVQEANDNAAREQKEMEDKAHAAGKVAIAKSETKLAKIAKQTNDLIHSKVAGIDGITVVDGGRFQLTEKITDEQIAEGFTTISGMVGTAENMREGFAMAEARFAQAIDAIGKSWILYFDPDESDQEKSIKRIKQSIGALNKMDKYEVELPKASISTIRNVMEAKYNKTDEKDNALRLKKVVQVLKDYFEKNDKYPPTNELRNIVADHKVEGGSKRHNWIYIISAVGDEVEVVGTSEEDTSLRAFAAVTIHVGSMSFILTGDPQKIPSPTDDLMKLAEAQSPKASTAEEDVEHDEEAEWQDEEADTGVEGEEESTEEVVEEVVEEEEEATAEVEPTPAPEEEEDEDGDWD